MPPKKLTIARKTLRHLNGLAANNEARRAPVVAALVPVAGELVPDKETNSALCNYTFNTCETCYILCAIP